MQPFHVHCHCFHWSLWWSAMCTREAPTRPGGTYPSFPLVKVITMDSMSPWMEVHDRHHFPWFPCSCLTASKKCTPLWREAHFEVKMYKTPHVRATFGGSDVEKVHAVVARSTFRSQNVKSTRGSDHFWRFRCRFASLHYNTLHYTRLHYTPLHTTIHYTTLHSTTVQL